MSRKFSKELASIGLKQHQFAEMIGIQPDTVSRWGNSIPTYATVIIKLLAEKQDIRRQLIAIGEKLK